MAELKTQRNGASVEDFVNAQPEGRREDCHTLLAMMSEISGEKPEMWGTAIVGFGTYHYKYATGREGDWMKLGFAPRKQNLTLYFVEGAQTHARLLEKLGKHSCGVGCVYVKRLADIDLDILREMIKASVGPK